MPVENPSEDHSREPTGPVSHRVSAADGEWQPFVVGFADRPPQRSATAPASPDSLKTQLLTILRDPRDETR